MNEQKLIKKIARLESINDQLVAELSYLNEITKKLGFAEGLKTLKAAALELLDEQTKEELDTDDYPPMTG